MKTLLYTVLAALSLTLASCGSNKNENEGGADSMGADTTADAPMPTNNDTMSVTTDTVQTTVPANDTITSPAP
jgi:hypothetical protein